MNSKRQEILGRLQAETALPVFPDVVVKLNHLLAREHTSAADIAKLLQFDASLTARILKLANSADFGAISTISTVPQAIARVGFKQIRDLVLSLTLIPAFKQRGSFDFRKFWRHSLAVAYAAQVIHRHAGTRPEAKDDLFVAGLLHDIGVLVLTQIAPDDYGRVLDCVKSEGKDLDETERLLLGIDHGEIGSALMLRWNLPKVVFEAVCFHHNPGVADQVDSLFSKIIHLANFVCNNQGLNMGFDAFPESFVESAWFDTNLSVEDIPAIIDEVNQRLAAVDQILSVS